MAKEKTDAKKKSFFGRFRTKKPIVTLVPKKEVVVNETPPVETPLVSEKKMLSAARVSTTPQMSHDGLSYAAQHLMLLLQHHVDAQHIKVPSTKPSWDELVQLNQSVDLIEKKDRAKEMCSIHHFSHLELDKLAKRVGKFVRDNQPQNVI